MKKGTLKIKFSNGFGNNIFQYVFGRLLSEHHGLDYDHDAIHELEIKEERHPFNKKLKMVKFKEKNNRAAKRFDENHQKWFTQDYEGHNFDFYRYMFYYEDYTLYAPHLEKIRGWFPKVEKTNTKDMVLHFRLQNRLIWETHKKNFINPEVYRETISSNFDFDNLYIVTDAEKWDYVTNDDIKDLHEKMARKYRSNPTKTIPIQESVDLMNNLVDKFKDFKPILRHSKKFIDDFNFMRSFDQIMFKNSTFAWWAAVLSDASKVGVYQPWKPNKGKRNKNLGCADFPGWFGWGE